MNPPKGKTGQGRVLTANLQVSGLTGLVVLSLVLFFEYGSGGTLAASPLFLVSYPLTGAALCCLVLWRTLRGTRSPHQDTPRYHAWVLRLPHVLAAVHMGVWTVLGVLAAMMGRWIMELPSDTTFMMGLAGLLGGVGGGLAGRFRTLSAASDQRRAALAELPAPAWAELGVMTPLNRQLALVLGGVVFFSSGLAAYAAFAVQRQAVAHHARATANGVRTAAQLLWDPLEPSLFCQRLQQVVPPGGAILFDDSQRGFCQLGTLPPAWSSRIRDTERQDRELRDGGSDSEPVPGWRGESVTLELDIGGRISVLVARPDWSRRALTVLLLSSTLLFLFSAFLAASTARGLTRPIVTLQRQVVGMQGGDLDSRVTPESADELGRLASSTDEMRGSLKEMMQEIQSLNLGLEEKVLTRTRELQFSNQELETTLQNLRRAQVQLIHAEKMAGLGRMMSGLAHELNNPVNAIMNTAIPLSELIDRLSEASPDAAHLERLRKGVRVIDHAARRTVELIRSMTTFSRPDEAARKPTDLIALLEATMDLLQHRIQAVGTRVEVRTSPLPSVVVLPGEMGQVLMNLLSNALDAVEASGTSGLIRVTTELSEGRAVVSVSDNGAGLTQESIPLIFEPFYTTKPTGMGLGLAICHQIITHHQGEIRVSSSPGQGTTFSIFIPTSEEGGTGNPAAEVDSPAADRS